MATSDDGILTTFTESDTYEPIETFQDLLQEKSAALHRETNDETKKQVEKNNFASTHLS